MRSRLSGLLDDLATEARRYGDPERAVATARRREAVRRVAVPLAAAALVLAAIAPVVLGRDPGGSPVTPSSPSPNEPAVAGYPARVTLPDPAEPLPESPTGAAAFVYSPCARTCDPYLVLPDGRQYGLVRHRLGPPTYGYTLSPDGVWLGRPSTATDGFTVRNLTTGRTLTIPDTGPGVTAAWAWAPSGRWLLLARHVDGTVDHYLLVDVVAGGGPRRLEPKGALAADTVMGVRDDGDLLVVLSGPDRPGLLPEYGIVDGRTAALIDRFAVTLPPGGGPLVREGERPIAMSLRFGPGGGAILTIGGPSNEPDLPGRPTGYLSFAISEGQRGRVWARTDLPVSAGSSAEPGGVWDVMAYQIGAVMLVHWLPDRTEIVLQNDVDGRRIVATTLPTDSQLVLRGGARY